MEAVDIDAEHGMRACGARSCRLDIVLQAKPRIKACGRIDVSFEQGGEMMAQVSGEGQVERGEFRVICRTKEQQNPGGCRRAAANWNDELPPYRQRRAEGPSLIQGHGVIRAPNRIEARDFNATQILFCRGCVGSIGDLYESKTSLRNGGAHLSHSQDGLPKRSACQTSVRGDRVVGKGPWQELRAR